MLEVSEILLHGKRYGETLIVIPFYKEYEYIEQHIRLLNEQKRRNFDVLIVSEPETDKEKLKEAIERASPKFGVIAFQRKENTGPAGGMFIGELFAISEGYENIIYSDVDCLPIDKGAVESLVSSLSHNSWPMLTQHSVDKEGKTVFVGPSGINHYSALKVSKLKEVGLRYLPLYYVDDVEFPYRLLKSGTKEVFKDEKCTHPNKPEVWLEKRPSPLLFYAESSLLRYNLQYYLAMLAMFVARQVAFLLYGRSRFRKKAISELRAFLGSFLPSAVGKRVLQKISWKLKGEVEKPEGERVSLELKDAGGYRPGTVPKEILAAMGEAVNKCAFREVIIENYDSWLLLLAAMTVAKKCYVRLSTGRYCLVSENPFAKWVVKTAIAPFLASGLLLLGIGVSIAKALLVKPLHFKYGLNEKLKVVRE